MKVRLTHIDGNLPNLALMRLGKYYRDRGDDVYFTRSLTRELFEQSDYDRVYGSSIFAFSSNRTEELITQFSDALVGGTGTGNFDTLETIIPGIQSGIDYQDYPEYSNSLGFLSRGCRLKCKFCVVPQKEGKPYHYQTVDDMWRGDPYPKHLHLLDNDFFGHPNWKQHVKDIVDGKFKVCFTQGINVRLINDEAAEAIAAVRYYDNNFKKRRIYTAWDNLGQEKVFFRGIERLEKAGVSPKHVMAYMLVGYAKDETLADILYRFNKMVELGIKPYPMVYNNERADLKAFQRWAVRRYYETMNFSDYKDSRKLAQL